MNDRVMAIPRVLIVEDEGHVLRSIKYHLASLHKDEKRHYGIEEFEFSEASDFETAMKLLRSAKETRSPYTLLLLDLQIPEYEGDRDDEKKKRGFDLLEYAVRGGAREDPEVSFEPTGRGAAALGAIVISNFYEYPNVVRSFQLGAVDFIGKSIDGDVPPRELQKQVLAYFRTQVISTFNHRLKNLIPHAQKRWANEMSDCLLTYERRVREITEGLKREAEERWGLDPIRDSHDGHIRHLAELDNAGRDAREEWRRKQSPWLGGDERPQPSVLETLLKEIRALILPCLMMKNLKLVYPEVGKILVMSFENDVYTVLAELFLGALSEIADHDDSAKKIEVYVEERNGATELRLEDDLAPIPERYAERINGTSGDRTIEPRYGRVWGLLMAQTIARRGGGRLTVRARSERGNIITYTIPSWHHE